MAIAQEELIGTLIPDVYIQGITLETSGTPIIEDEPHTISQRELESLERFNTAAADESMKVTIDLSLKEKFDNDMLGSWFHQNEFYKYMKVKLIQTTDKYIIEILSNSQSAIDLSNTGLSPNDFGPEGYGSDDDNELNDLAVKLGYVTSSQANEGTASAAWVAARVKALSYFTANTTMVTFNLGSISNANLLEQHSETVDTDGNTVHDFTFRATFNNLKSSVSNLAYFAVSYMDFAQLEQDYNLAYDFSGTGGSFGEQNGKVASELVIKDNKVVSSSFLFKNSFGDIWSGPVHQMEDGRWMSGSKHGEGSAYLNREVVPNTKVQDFRDVKEIKRLQIDLSSVENEIFVPEGQTKILSNDKMAVPRKHFYFSDIWLSRDANGDARFMFAWDFGNFIRRNARYGKLFDNSSSELKQQVIDSSKIHSLAVYRKRVRDVMTQNQLGSPWRGEVDFNKDDPPELIAISGERNAGFVKVDNGAGSLRQTKPSLTENQVGIKYFTGMDKTMRRITDGEYQYGIVAEVQDGTIDYLKGRLETLSLCRWMLQQYLHEGSKPGMTRYIAEFANPHIDRTHAESVITANSPGHYDPMTNRFTKAFATLMADTYEDVQQAPYVKCVVEYISALQLVTNALTSGGNGTHGTWVDRLNAQEMIEKLQNFIAPSSGNPQGVQVMIDLYDLLIGQYARLVGEDVRPPMVGIDKSLDPSPPESSIATSSPDVLMEHKHWFYNHSFDSNVKKRTGINYLDTPGTAAHSELLKEVADLASMNNTDGLKAIDGRTWEHRVSYETEQFFPSTTADCNISYGNTSYTSDDSLAAQSMSYLTPVSVHTAAENYVCSVNQSHEQNTLMVSDMMTDNVSSVSQQANYVACSNASDASIAYTNSMSQLFSEYNLTTVPVLETSVAPLMFQLNQAGALTEACAAKQGEPIDPHPAWNRTRDGRVEAIKMQESCDPQMDSECDPTDEDKNADYAEFLRMLANDVLSGNSEPGNIPSTATFYQDNSLDTSQIYDLTQANNVVSWMEEDPQMLQTVLQTNGHSTNGTVSDAISSSPNQVKALLLSSTAPSAVNFSWYTDGVDFVADVTVSSTFKINYGFLMKVEYFDGFGESGGDPQSAYGSQQNIPSIKKQVWKKLDPQSYGELVGKEILCRLNPYELESIGIRTYDGIRMPVYDSYFFLRPVSDTETVVQSFPSMLEYLRSLAEQRMSQDTFYTEFISSNIISE